MNVAICVEHLHKTFHPCGVREKSVKALDDVSLEVYEGEILGILGPNGAGKTTFLNILSTLLLPDSGTVEILGIKSTPKNFSQLRRILNMSSGYPNFPWSLTVEENLRFYGRLYGLSAGVLNQKIKNLIEMFALGDLAKRRFDELSSGNKQKLSLTKAMLNDPRIIFLDEPTVGLDPEVSIKTREIILDILRKAKVTVLLTTHNMAEAELMCGRVAFIKQGKVLHLASPQELKRMHNSGDLEEVFVKLAQGRFEKQPLSKEPARPQPAAMAAADLKQIFLAGEVLLWLRRCWAFACRNFLFAVRNLFAFMELLFWPVVSLISIGLMGDYLELQEKALGFILTGAITAGVLQVAQLDVAYGLLYEVWSKSLKHTLLTPVGISESLVGSWLIGILRGSSIFIVLGIAASILFGFQFPSLWGTLIFLTGIFGCALLLGILVSILILIYGQKAEITAWMFAYIFMLICGIYYPIETLPKVLMAMAEWLPVTYFLEYYRQGFGFLPKHEWLLLKGFALVAFYLFIGLAFMRHAFHQARKKGTIVRLSE